MAEQENLQRRLQEYQEYKERETRFSTKEEFKKFCSENHVYYPAGFGAYVQRLIRTDEEFIEFMLKCGVMGRYDGDYYPWFVNDYQHDDEDQHLFFVSNPFEDSDTELDTEEIEAWESDGEFSGYMPNVPIVAYHVDYNQFYDDPFSVVRDDDYKTYAPGTFRVNPKTSAKWPAIVRFVSMDDFDRYVSIKGESLSFIPLKDVEDGQIMFL